MTKEDIVLLLNNWLNNHSLYDESIVLTYLEECNITKEKGVLFIKTMTSSMLNNHLFAICIDYSIDQLIRKYNINSIIYQHQTIYYF